jgi:predicted N-formylglutamate amidohydrolase
MLSLSPGVGRSGASIDNMPSKPWRPYTGRIILSYPLLAADEPAAVFALRRGGGSPFVIVVDHASRRIPKRLGSLGLSPPDLERHIAWDIGALAVAQGVSSVLDAPLVAQNYSRLVIDCNRRPEVATSIPVFSESTEIPGNAALTAAEVEARRRQIFEPYHDHLRVLLDERAARGKPTVFVAQHSMTDVFKGARREMHAAVLYNREPRFARHVLGALRQERGLVVAENRPYALSDATDYTVPHHAEARALPCVEIEIRQDLIRSEAGQAQWAERIGRALNEAWRRFGGDG